MAYNTDYLSMRSDVIVREIRNVILSTKEALTLICRERGVTEVHLTLLLFRPATKSIIVLLHMCFRLPRKSRSKLFFRLILQKLTTVSFKHVITSFPIKSDFNFYICVCVTDQNM